MPLVVFGMVFTDWRLTTPSLVAMLAALAGSSARAKPADAIGLPLDGKAWRSPSDITTARLR